MKKKGAISRQQKVQILVKIVFEGKFRIFYTFKVETFDSFAHVPDHTV